MLVVKTFVSENIKLRVYACIGWGKLSSLSINFFYYFSFTLNLALVVKQVNDQLILISFRVLFNIIAKN